MILKLLSLLLALPLLLPQGLCVCQALPCLFEHDEIASVETASPMMSAVDTAKGCCHCHRDDVPEPNTNQSLNSSGLLPDSEHHSALFVEAVSTVASDLVVYNIAVEGFTLSIADDLLQGDAAPRMACLPASRTLAHFSLRI